MKNAVVQAAARCYLCSMSDLLLGLLVLLAATNNDVKTPAPPAPMKTVLSARTADANDPAEQEYRKLLAEDDAASADVEKLIRENESFREKGAALSEALMEAKIQQRFEKVRAAWQDFLQRHPRHVAGWIAYGSFLNDLGEEFAAREQWEKALALDPKNPAIYNNLANSYGHRGPVQKAFEFYTRAIELEPAEPVYYHNFGTTVFLFRKDAQAFWKIDEPAVFDKALELYDRALRLDPENFLLAHDIAQTYYGIKPRRAAAELAAWERALKLAGDDFQREGVRLHLARSHLNSGRFSAARQQLGLVKDPRYNELRERVTRTLEKKEREAAGAEKTGPAETK